MVDLIGWSIVGVCYVVVGLILAQYTYRREMELWRSYYSRRGFVETAIKHRLDLEESGVLFLAVGVLMFWPLVGLTLAGLKWVRS